MSLISSAAKARIIYYICVIIDLFFRMVIAYRGSDYRSKIMNNYIRSLNITQSLFPTTLNVRTENSDTRLRNRRRKNMP